VQVDPKILEKVNVRLCLARDFTLHDQQQRTGGQPTQQYQRVA
jgi:hypothetical protein